MIIKIIILIEYSNDKTIHSTFKELLEHVYSRIESNINKDEIKSVLNEEIKDAECKCYTVNQVPAPKRKRSPSYLGSASLLGSPATAPLL
jgi:hypothetical protein